MRHLYIFVTLLQTVMTFTVLPYIQIDYAHYFRLAQCLAKCMQKYGVPSTHHLLDGSIEEFLDVRNKDAEACDSGCHQHRRVHRKGQLGLTMNSITDGQRFWAESSAKSGLVGSTVISSVELICQNPSPDEEFGVSAEGFVSVSLLRPSGAIRFIVQWKQRTQVMGFYDESQWITSQWTHSRSTISIHGHDTMLTVKNGYNSDRGVTAQIEWPRTALDSCYYKLQLSNSSFQVTMDITADSSKSILLPHLEFDTLYSVTVAAISADKTKVSNPTTTNFKSLPCKDIHGRGSLQCLPEAVSDLTIVLRSNGTGLISWKPSADPQNILFYQVVYYALSYNDGCQIQKETLNVKSTETSAEVTFPGRECEYVIQLINYDLIGRDASAEVRVLIEPSLLIRFNEILPACVVFLSLSCALICFRCRKKCPHRVSEKQRKFAGYA
uniref:Fibronectin type-III domain-containing protein n=1 Tax=Angiostrongylus cantonensis TaxID=6313 RepID=A0A0K0DEV3_ANGCA